MSPDRQSKAEDYRRQAALCLTAAQRISIHHDRERMVVMAHGSGSRWRGSGLHWRIKQKASRTNAPLGLTESETAGSHRQSVRRTNHALNFRRSFYGALEQSRSKAHISQNTAFDPETIEILNAADMAVCIDLGLNDKTDEATELPRPQSISRGVQLRGAIALPSPSSRRHTALPGLATRHRAGVASCRYYPGGAANESTRQCHGSYRRHRRNFKL